jgi:hypothetical protein
LDILVECHGGMKRREQLTRVHLIYGVCMVTLVRLCAMHVELLSLTVGLQR